MLADLLYSQMQAGGWVLLPIFLVGTIGFFILGLNIIRMGRDFYRGDYASFLQEFNVILRSGNIEAAKAHLLKRRGLISSELLPGLDHSNYSRAHLYNMYQERMSRILNSMDRGMQMAGVLAATAPLLGLLGTVTGMVRTFEIITMYGNSNPVLMADGISEALITTQSGLIIAFPMILGIHRIEERIQWLKKQMEYGVTLILNEFYHSQEDS